MHFTLDNGEGRRGRYFLVMARADGRGGGDGSVGAGGRQAAGASAPRRTGRRARPRPVFVVCAARSGSTLLRYLLDSHPEVVCPPELDLSSLLEHVIEVWSRRDDARGSGPVPGAQLSPQVCSRARKVIDEVMGAFAADAGASVFADKSLSTVNHLPALSQCYPDASYVLLYRYPLDLIASGIESSQWGFRGHFRPYVRGNLSNLVSGLGDYWIDRASKMVEFEKSCSVAHTRVYYERLCDDPASTLKDLLGFLDLDYDEALIELSFNTEHGLGPGDFKIDFTRSISLESVGRGSTIPKLLTTDQVARTNELLAQLDYPPLHVGWSGGLAEHLALHGSDKSSEPAGRIAETVVAILARRKRSVLAETHLQYLPIEVVVRTGDTGGDAYLLIGCDGRVDLAGEPDSPGPNGARHISFEGDVLLRIVKGDVTLASAFRDRRVRFEPEQARPLGDPRLRRTLAALAAVITPEKRLSGA
jgi:hypothetical protein